MNGPLKGIREVYEKVAMVDMGSLEYCAGNSKKKHGLLETDHRTSRVNGRILLVVRLPALQMLPFGYLHLVGIDGTRRQQQQKEEALQLVMCSLCRPIRMESAQQDTGGAARCQRQ